MTSHLQKFAVLLLCSFFISFQLSGQDGKIEGIVTDQNEALAYTTVVLKSTSDSSIVKAEITANDGRFVFSNTPYDSYFIEVSYVGMETYRSEELNLNQKEIVVPPILMTTASTKMKEIEVVAKRPLIEVMADKTVFNVENTLNSTGTNGFELLRKAPGVIIDNNNSIILEGKTGVLIYINGKPSPLAGEDLTNFLSSLQSSDIDKIEIITQPSSKYDAAGNAGIINIKLKKDKRLGTNGTVAAGYAYGRNGRPNTSVSLNNRTKTTNFFGNYSHSSGDTWDFINLDRTQGNLRFDAETENVRSLLSNNVRAGVDFFPNDKHTFGVLLDGNFYDRDENGVTTTPIIPLATGQVQEILIANNVVTNQSYNLAGNLNYRYEDTLGHELTVDVDYGRYNRDRTSFQPNSYTDPTGEVQFSEANFRMITPTDIDIITGKIDYSQNFMGGKLALGGKYSLVVTDNTFSFFDVEDGNDIFNAERSNEFEYTENINAAYVNYNIKKGKWNLQTGLRVEQTVSEGNLISTQQTEDKNVKRNYWNWFPSGGLTYSPNYKNSWALTYSRRIQRPDYASLNPFEYQLNELSFSRGNPFLQPQYTNNIKLSHTYKYRLTTSLSYSRINDFFAKITETLGETRNFLITRNIANQDIVNLGVSYPFDVNKWWSVYTSVNAYRAAYQGSDENFVSVDRTTVSLYAQNSFILPEGFRLEVSGWFSSPSVWSGTYLTKSMGSLNVAIQKKLMNDRLSVRIAGSDILFTSFWRADYRFGDLYIDGSGGWESRQVKVNVSYRFGRNEIKQSRKRNTGLQEESQRTGGS
ncbi:MAG: TonB-dependent receptor [Bacteroidota bacterium]